MTSAKSQSDVSLDETSSMASGAVSFGASNSAGEEEIREMIRKSIKIYSKKRNNLSQEQIQENKLRNIIRKLILEQEDAEQDSVSDGTWKNVLGELLNIVIPQMREKYVQLQTNMVERQGFKDYVSNYYSNQFEQVDNADQLQREKELEEQEKVPKIDQIKVKVRANNPDFIDIDDKSPRDKPEKKKKEDQESRDAQTDEEIGQTFAEEFVQSVGERVVKDYRTKVKKGQDRENFKRVFFANIDSWYDIWDENEPVSMQGQPTDLSEPDQEESGGDLDLDLPPDEAGLADEPLDEDLLGLLEADLE